MATGVATRNHIRKNGVKILVIGHDRVGKTTMIKKFCEIVSKVIPAEMETFKFMEASLFDMPNLRKLTIGTANAFILTYAVDDDESFDYITTLISNVQKVKGPHVPLIVVANKTDKPVPIEKRIIADCVVTIDYECEHLEVCAHNGKNLDAIVQRLLEYYGKYLLFPYNEDNEAQDDNQNGGQTLSKNFKKSLQKVLCLR